MNFKTTYILFALLGIVLLIFVWVLVVGPTNTEATAYVLPSMHKEGSPLEPKDITRVEIERKQGEGTEKLVFVRDAGSEHWRILEPRDYPADRFAIDGLVRQIYNARLIENSDVVNNPKQYGLDSPAEVVTLIKEADPRREVKLNVGNTSPGDQQAVIYVTSSDRKEVMAVKKSELDSVKKSLGDFRSRELLSPATGDIQQFTLSQRSKDKVIKGPLELKKSGDERWVYVQPSYGDAQDKGTNPAGEDKPPTNVDTVLSDISNLKVQNGSDFVKDDATDLGKYNLDPAKDDILRIEIERVESSKKDEKGEKETKRVALVVGVGKKVDDKSDQYYAYLDEPKHKDIIKLPAKNVARLLKLLDQPEALRERNLVAFGGLKKPDAVNIENSYGLLELRRESSSPPGPPGMPPRESWKLWRGDKSYAVDEATVQALVTMLTAPNQVEGFVDDPAEKKRLGLDKPDAVVRIWADSLSAEETKKDDTKDEKKDDKKDEKKDKKPQPKDKDKPAFTLSFGALKDGKASVERKRGDEKASTVVLVPVKVRDQVREGPLAYLDKQLPPFTGNRFDPLKDVTKLTLTRDGTTYEISREDKPDAPWKIDKPSDFAGRTADSDAIRNMLNDLNNLRAVKIEADKLPDDAKLASWGLKEPRLKAVVTRMEDKKPKTYEFAFGKETDDKNGVYLRTSQQDMIVVAGTNVVNTLKRELQDPTVLHFDVAKVQEVKVTGWITLQKQLGSNTPLTRTFKRTKDGWEVEPKDSIKLDASRLNDFLKNLSDLKAVKFVAHKAKPSADQELEVDKGALHIELTLAAEKEPKKLTLTVGKVDGNTGYFAISNQLPGDIFEVRKDLFDKVKEKPAYFSGQ